jgi:hypothetical protein
MMLLSLIQCHPPLSLPASLGKRVLSVSPCASAASSLQLRATVQPDLLLAWLQLMLVAVAELTAASE